VGVFDGVTVRDVVRTDSLALAGARGQRWLPDRPVQSIEDAARFVDDVGFALLFPSDRPTAPSLWEAVAGPDATPFATSRANTTDRAASRAGPWCQARRRAGMAAARRRLGEDRLDVPWTVYRRTFALRTNALCRPRRRSRHQWAFPGSSCSQAGL
jgi:hypothetical protein